MADRADFVTLLVRRQLRQLEVIGRAVSGDLAPLLVQRLDTFRPFLNSQPVHIDGSCHIIALEYVEDAPDAGLAAVIGLREQGHVDRTLRGAPEPAAFAERLTSDAKSAANLPVVRPFQPGRRLLNAFMHEPVFPVFDLNPGRRTHR